MANNITDPKELADYSIEAKTAKKGVKSPTVPVICIPTSLSGGEYFSHAGGTDDITTKYKQGFMQNGMGVSLVILDAELSIGTPWFYWLSTGMRSIDHCVEALCSLVATTQSDEDAEAGLRLLIPNLLKTKVDDKDVEARHKCRKYLQETF
jgi:alcohol dehydrogenase class IV